MKRLHNTVPYMSIAAVLYLIRNEELHEEAEAQNIPSMYGDVETALGGLNIPSFNQTWEADEAKVLPTNEDGEELLDSDEQDKILSTAEILYLLVFSVLLTQNQQLSSFKDDFESHQEFFDTCAEHAYDLVSRALINTYTEENDIYSIELVQAQKVLLNLNSFISSRVNVQTFKALGDFEAKKLNAEDAYRILDFADTVQWWTLELNEEFRDAPQSYI